MFMNFSMVKDGAFMVCESVAEYDSNVADTPVPQNEETSQELVEACKNNYCMREVVIKKLQPLFNEYINMNSDYRPATREEAYNILCGVHEYTNRLADTLRFCILKVNALYNYLFNSNWSVEGIRPFTREIFNHIDILRKEGKDIIPIEKVQLKNNIYTFDLDRIANYVTTLTDTLTDKEVGVMSGSLLDIYTDVILPIFKDNNFSKTYLTNTYTLGLDSLVNMLSHINEDREISCEKNPTTLITMISILLRKISMLVYSAKCDIMDKLDEEIGYINEYHKSVVLLGNMITVSFCYLLVVADKIDNVFAERKGIETWLKSLKEDKILNQ